MLEAKLGDEKWDEDELGWLGVERRGAARRGVDVVYRKMESAGVYRLKIKRCGQYRSVGKPRTPSSAFLAGRHTTESWANNNAHHLYELESIVVFKKWYIPTICSVCDNFSSRFNWSLYFKSIISNITFYFPKNTVLAVNELSRCA